MWSMCDHSIKSLISVHVVEHVASHKTTVIKQLNVSVMKNLQNIYLSTTIVNSMITRPWFVSHAQFAHFCDAKWVLKVNYQHKYWTKNSRRWQLRSKWHAENRRQKAINKKWSHCMYMSRSLLLLLISHSYLLYAACWNSSQM
jgi:hypothetical protein